MEEELYKQYPIDDSCYWTDWDTSLKDEGSENLPRISTIVTVVSYILMKNVGLVGLL